MYLTLGNIPKEIRRKPSSGAYILLGYLPTTHLEHLSNKSAKRRCLVNLYHACMKKIFDPLESAGAIGIPMTTGNGLLHRVHPILACVAVDYPEQVLTTAVVSMECPACPTRRDSLGTFDPRKGPPELWDLDGVLDVLDSFDHDPSGFLQACDAAGIKPIIEPFWKDLPYVNIYQSITPDILHQLYQGVIKHLVAWVLASYGIAEIDARCRRLPPNHNIRLFMKGISSLSRVTGREHDQMAHILLGLVLHQQILTDLARSGQVCIAP